VLVCTLEMGQIRAEQRDWALALTHDGRHDLLFTRGKRRKPTSSNRNEVALAFKRNEELDFLLTVDADVVPPPSVLDYVDEDLDVVVFPCHLWRANENADHPVLLNVALEDSPSRWVEKRQRLVEVARGGSGAMLIARRVMEHPDMRAPFADGFDADGIRDNGHDLMFCDRAREAGFRVWAAMDCVCSHYKTVDLKRVSQLLRRKRLYDEAFVPPRRALEGNRLIFCLSPGRCGTRYLAMLIGTIPGVLAMHEPRPNFADVMRAVEGSSVSSGRDAEVAYGFWLERKLPAILAGLQANASSVYVETSHLFGQGFVEPLVNLGVVPDAIVLTRPAREVALSYWRRGSIPGRTKRGRTYLLPPPRHLLDAGQDDGWTDYQLCYWFVREMERRAAMYAEMLRGAGAQVYPVHLEDLLIRDGFAYLTAYLNLGEPDWDVYKQIEGLRVNATPAGLRNRMPEGDLAALEQEVDVWMDS